MDMNRMPYIHRDISWLSFNYRVLQEARDPHVPLFERIKFLGIYSSNLDEYFRVRIASLRSLIRLGKKTKRRMIDQPEELLAKIQKIVEEQQVEFSQIYQNHILPQLRIYNIYILRRKELNNKQLQFLDQYYEDRLIEYLQPALIVRNKVRTYLCNNVLYLAVVLATTGGGRRYAVVEVPSKKFPRFVQLPASNPEHKELIILDDIVRHCLPKLFPGYKVVASYSVKMTRDSDLNVEDEYEGDLVEKIRKGLSKRNIGPGTRFVYDRKMLKQTLDFFQGALSVSDKDLQPEGRYHNNTDFFRFPDFKLNHLKDRPMPSLPHPKLESYKNNLFQIIRKGDQLLHYPYQKYSYVIRFLEQAAHDPDVTEIKIAQYRVAKDSQVVNALRSALEEGKKVMVFMEIKARFDEEANLYWAERLESWGAKVLYSLPELKVHAKLCLVNRIEEGKKALYSYMSTGNFNEDTARIYGDYGFFTADKRLSNEVDMIFDYLEYGKHPRKPFKHLLVGQFRMRRNIYDMINQEIKNAKAGKTARIIVKVNSIQDKRMIARLYEASNAGVEIKLIVRGVCCLVPDIEGYSKNIEVISIVDRFLEHVRAYLFYNDGEEKIYLSSADWMTRNLHRRIENAFPVYDEKLRQEIRDFLQIQFRENVKARIIDEQQNNFYRRHDIEHPWRSQERMYEYYQRQLEK
ncbi:MAG: polyphosphate kinase 1 [Saprospiraceae bacterium]|nr:polyphosphate kinase 1 [Saprospiraceae bacterium]